MQIELKPERLIELGLWEEDLKDTEITVFKPKGCPKCSDGYRGRFAILETLRFTEPVRRLIIDSAALMDVKSQGVRDGMVTLRRCGLRNTIRGITSVEEVVRVTMAD